MRSHRLARLLLALPDTEVTTWNAEFQEPHEVEQVIRTSDGELVLGMEMGPGWTVDGAEVVWTAHALARAGLDTACAQWARAKKEGVGS